MFTAMLQNMYTIGRTALSRCSVPKFQFSPEIVGDPQATLVHNVWHEFYNFQLQNRGPQVRISITKQLL